jgi:hypothetical protein
VKSGTREKSRSSEEELEPRIARRNHEEEFFKYLGELRLRHFLLVRGASGRFTTGFAEGAEIILDPLRPSVE